MKTLFYRSAHGLGRLFVKPFLQVTTLPLMEGGIRFESTDNVQRIFIVNSKRAVDEIVFASCLEQLKLSGADVISMPRQNDRSIADFFESLHLHTHQERQVVIVPVSIFWGRTPKRAKGLFQSITAQNWAVMGGVKRLLTVLTQSKHVYCYFGSDIALTKGLEGDQQALLNQCKSQFIRQKETLIGPDLSHQRMMVDKVLQHTSVRTYIDHSDENHAKLEKKASKYIKEIASDYSYTVVRIFDVFLTWLWEKLYQGVEVSGIEKLQNVAETHELVYVPCHRSHIDYLLLSFVIYRQGLMPPHVAAGINLNLPVLGKLLRGAGAFFIRRKFRDKPLYKVTLEAYINTMCKEGFSIEYFVEGGRSRTGLLLQPRPGMLTMTLKASLDTTDKPIAFVPVYIGYEKLLESHSYINELYGAKKQKETLGALFSTRKKLKKKHGKVYLNIGEPFLLSDMYVPDVNQTDEQFRQCVRNAGTQIMTAINSAATVTPVNLMATALLASSQYALLRNQLRARMAFLHVFCGLPRLSQSLSVHEREFDEVVMHAVELDLIRINECEGADIILLDQSGQVSATFLRNNNLHVFILPSLIASILVVSEKITVKRLKAICLRLYPYLKAELFLPWELDELDAVIDQILALLSAEKAVFHEGLYYRPVGEESEEYHALSLLAKVAEGNFQRFYMTALLLGQSENNQYTEDTLVEACMCISRRFSLLHECHEPDFLDKNLFKNFISQLIAGELISTDDHGYLSGTKGLQMVIKYAVYVLSPEARRSIGHVIASAEK